MGKWYDWIAVCGTVFLITFVPISSQLLVLVPWLTFSGESGQLILLLPFNIAVLSIWTNYFLACRTDPGHTPTGYHPLNHQQGGLVERKKSSGGLRFCRKCNAFKPPRAHHCSECKRCVLKMDHHCPWLNNCVGFYNHGYFVRFICSVGLASSYLLCLFGVYLTRLINSQQYSFHSIPNLLKYYAPAPSNLALVIMIVNVIILVILLLTVGILSLWQLYYIASNTTTIESLENDKIDSLVRKGVISSTKRYPYDLGSALENMKTVLGPRVLFWWVPLPMRGDGVRFSVNPELLSRSKRKARGRKGIFGWIVGWFSSSEARTEKNEDDSSDDELVDLSWPPEEYYEYKAGYAPSNMRASAPSNSPVRDASRLIESSESEGDENSSGDDEQHVQEQHSQFQRRRLIRRGSEGYLVRTGDLAPVRGPYVSESESEEEFESSDDDIPLNRLKTSPNKE
ncbi:Palmitoyltransferase [Chytriomyces hyalinus]|nr:Palmitoyltransferase [Chytriomyces hyalinus]